MRHFISRLLVHWPAFSKKHKIRRNFCSGRRREISINERQDVPEATRESFYRLMSDVSRCGAVNNEESVRATINKIDDAEVKRVVQKIISLYTQFATMEKHRDPR